MYTGVTREQALKRLAAGHRVLMLTEYDDGAVVAYDLDNLIPDNAEYVVKVPAVENLDFSEAVEDMVVPTDAVQEDDGLDLIPDPEESAQEPESLGGVTP